MSNPIVWPAAPDTGVWLKPGHCGENPTDPTDPTNPTNPGTGGLKIPPAKFITRDYTLVPADILGIIVATSLLPINITIPPGMPDGWVKVVQGSSGQVFFLPGEGVQIDVPPNKRGGTNGRNTTAELLQLGPLRWNVGGTSLAAPLPPDVFFGVTPMETLTAESIQALGQGLQAAALPITVTYDATGGRYPFIAYPASWAATTTALINGLLYSDLAITQVDLPNGLGATVPYRVLRFRGKQNGSSIKVTW